ncbi:MAG: hypothetical protein J3R72DRAFT_491635 [Linnemannia gamsii]|nr:MAG: hypothetical protein J3R72DRAFT_491635 [Linnemannia gamsii]
MDNKDNLEKPVFKATFDALWFYRNRDEDIRKRIQGRDAYGKGDDGGVMKSTNEKEGAREEGHVGVRQRHSRRMNTFAFGEDFTEEKTIWRKALWQLMLRKFLINSPPVIECHDFSLEFSITRPLSLPLPSSALHQVYSTLPSKLVGVFVAIITMGCLFVYLEILQASQDSTRYSRSSYSMLDVLAFVLPTFASVQQLYFIPSQDAIGRNVTLSFSVLAIYLHMLIELRIIKSVCKYSMVIFLLTTTVLMMNVMIALINVAFAKGDDAWRLAWIKSRLRYIESAENLSYHIPGFHQTYDWFPKEIYFTVTAKEIEDYLMKHLKSRREEHTAKFESQHTTSSRTFSNTGDTPNEGGTSRYHNEATFSLADMTPRNDASRTSNKKPFQSLLRGTRGGAREHGGGDTRQCTSSSNGRDMDSTVVMELLHKLEDQMKGVSQQAQESQLQALESQRQTQESQRHMELNRQQMQVLIESRIQLRSSIPVTVSSF